MGSSLGFSDSVAGHLVTLKFYKNNFNNHYFGSSSYYLGSSDSVAGHLVTLKFSKIKYTKILF